LEIEHTEAPALVYRVFYADQQPLTISMARSMAIVED